ncbi:MAG TPA: hypothetical protein VFW75_01970 [Acetobacteraceae bacterium]|nr:hypothetical protein [Acetobacteraceae bacterium]
MIRARVVAAALLATLAAAAPAESAAPATASRLFDAVDEVHGDRVIGVLRLDGADRMSIEHAVPDREAWLINLVTEMNAKDRLTLSVPPSRSAPRYALQGIPVQRGDPRFLAALRSYLHRYYELALR